MTLLTHPPVARPAPRSERPSLRGARIGLLGLGRVGSAVADLLTQPAQGAQLVGVLVRNVAGRANARGWPLVRSPRDVFDTRPDVLVEALGGLEPARSIVLDALARGIPVVTANKTLLAIHGDELFEAAAGSGTPFRYEAAVIAGVPFLGAFARRPLAAEAFRLTGILNGTTNFILSRIDEGAHPADALAEAREVGLAEPDPSKDLDGSDAAEKLAVLIRQFARLGISPDAIPRRSIDDVGPLEMDAARELGGRIKPVAVAEWRDDVVACYAGPGFLRASDPLAALDGELNGLRIESSGRLPLHLTGPGAGPEATARTIADDVLEVLADQGGAPAFHALRPASVSDAVPVEWHVTLRAASLSDPIDLSDLLSAHGVWVQRWGSARTASGSNIRAFLTFPCCGGELRLALEALEGATSCSARAFPVVEVRRG